MKIKVYILFVALVALFTLPVQGQIRVTKAANAFTKNLSLKFTGISGNAKASKAVNSFLQCCGWFDACKGNEQPDLTIAGTYNNFNIQLSVKKDNRLVAKLYQQVKNNNYDAAAKILVDQILRKLFKIQGICNSRIVFCGQGGVGIKNIYVCDINGKNVKKVTNYKNLCVEPEWFPDGKSVVYTKYNKSSTDIIQTNLFPLRSRRLASYPGTNVGATISPNGKYLALIMSKDRQVELYVKSLQNGKKKRLTHANSVEASPCWSPTGGALCFVSDRLGTPQLFIVSANGGNARRLSTVGGATVTPAWSQDNQIVYTSKYGSNYVLALLDLTGKKKSGPIVNAAGNWESPSWAPDNRHVICSRTLGKVASLWIVDTWSGRARQLLRAANNLTMPAWSNIIK